MSWYFFWWRLLMSTCWIFDIRYDTNKWSLYALYASSHMVSVIMIWPLPRAFSRFSIAVWEIGWYCCDIGGSPPLVKYVKLIWDESQEASMHTNMASKAPPLAYIMLHQPTSYAHLLWFYYHILMWSLTWMEIM